MSPTPALDRWLAGVGLGLNLVALLALPVWLAADVPLVTANLVVGLAAILPSLVLGIIASAALLARRRWGRVLAIVALSLSLAVALSYGIVWLVLVPLGRTWLAMALGSFSITALLLLIYWSLPRPWGR
ncbi:MAG: hypothetical protein ACO28R_05645 [Vulcanococcus sp.]